MAGVASLAITNVLFCSASNTDLSTSFNQRLGSGVNLGNALEAPTEGAWGVTLQPEYFRRIKEAGFQHVRIPVRWSAHCQSTAPYTIDAKFLERVDWAVQQAKANSLGAVINMHHFEEFEVHPDLEHDRFISMWKQIAKRFESEPNTVAFEIYNEPCKAIDSERWNRLAAEALAVIRKSNPQRIVVIGPTSWNNFHDLNKLTLPNEDRNLLVTFHYYEPFHFTHQGAEWAGAESQSWLGTTWSGSSSELKVLNQDFDSAQAWAKANNRPIYLGEFGAYSKGDMNSRAKWTGSVREAARERGFSSAYWEFCSGFGCFDSATMTWRQPLLDALIPAKHR